MPTYVSNQTVRVFTLRAFLALSVMAASQASAYDFYVDSQVGAMVNPMNHDNFVKPTPTYNFTQNYKTTGSTDTVADVGLRLGVLTPLNTRWAMEFGVGYQVNTQQALQGDYYATTDDTTVDNTYQYTLNLQSLMADTRLYFNQNCSLSYFAGGGIGLGFISNSAVAMQTNQTGAQPLESKSNHDTRTVYSLTAGLQWHVNNHWNLESGVSQSYFGKNYISMSSGTQMHPNYTKIDMGLMQPWQFWIGMGYQF